MRKYKTIALAVISTFAIPDFNAYAAGFYIQEQSVSGLGSAFAGQVATPRDSSTVYFNPAGMTKLKGSHANFGINILAPSAKLTNTGSVIPLGGATGGNGGNPYEPTPIPNGSISHEFIEDQVWIGISVSAPFGLANEYDKGWFGRFDSTKSRLTTIDIQPSFAVKLNDKLSIGGGVNIQYADANLEKIVNLGAGETTSILNGDDMTIGYNLGILYEPIEGTTLGAHYRSGLNHELEGRVDIIGSTNLVATADLNLPKIIQFGVNHKINDKLSLLGGATWFGWNSFKEIRVLNAAGGEISNTIQNYQNTWAFAIGAEYEYNNKWTLRTGYQFDATPTTDEFRTTLTPDGDRNWISTGATYKFSDRISLDLAATYIDIGNETINVSRNNNLATIKAKTSGNVGIFALGLNYKF